MKNKAIAEVRNLSPFLKEEINTVLDFVYKGRRIQRELTYFTAEQEPRKVTRNGEETRILVKYFDANLMPQPLIYESDSRIVIVLPYLGAGTSYEAQIKAFNRFGSYLTEWLIDYDDTNVENEIVANFTAYKRDLRSGQNASWFYDGQHITLDKYPLMLDKLRRQLSAVDDRFNDDYFALKDENRRFGLKSGKVFYYKGTNKVEMKLGKGIRKLSKLINIELDDNQLKNMVSRISSLNAPFQLDIVEGEDIGRAYYYTNHFNDNLGTLSASCMRHNRCQDEQYFNLYFKNAKLLVLRHPSTLKIKARALLWESTNGDKLMDRIYGADNQYHLFFDWAITNGYHRKKWQSSSNPSDWVDAQGYEHNTEYRIALHEGRYRFRSYPYMDTFFYLNKTQKYLGTTREDTPYDEISMLRSTGGGTS